MQNVQKQDPCETVVGYDRHKVVDRGDQRTGCDSRVKLQLFEKQRYAGAGNAGKQHRSQHGDTRAEGNGEGEQRRFALENEEIKPDENKRNKAENEAVEETYARFLENKGKFLFSAALPNSGIKSRAMRRCRLRSRIHRDVWVLHNIICSR